MKVTSPTFFWNGKAALRAVQDGCPDSPWQNRDAREPGLRRHGGKPYGWCEEATQSRTPATPQEATQSRAPATPQASRTMEAGPAESFTARGVMPGDQPRSPQELSHAVATVPPSTPSPRVPEVPLHEAAPSAATDFGFLGAGRGRHGDLAENPGAFPAPPRPGSRLCLNSTLPLECEAKCVMTTWKGKHAPDSE